MTRWDTMTADERNALIAETVFGRKVYREKTWKQWLLHHETKPGWTQMMPDYSTSFDAAWLIIRHFAALPDKPFEPYWRKRLFMHALDILPCSNEVFYDIPFSTLADLTPEMICKAALEAMEYKHEVRE